MEWAGFRREYRWLGIDWLVSVRSEEEEREKCWVPG